MQILVISDTHGAYENLKSVILSHPGAQYIIFCGDGEDEIVRFRLEYPEKSENLISVRGNCDSNPDLPLSAVLDLPYYGHRIAIVHGHKFMYGHVPTNLAIHAKQAKADILVFGHLHARIDVYYNGIKLFNPGSAALPRDGKPASFGLIDVFESETGILSSHGDVKPMP